MLREVAIAVGRQIRPLDRLPGGLNAGAMRVRVGDRGHAVLKVEARTGADALDGALRARRIVDHMRARGYPTPAWIGVGATAAHVWQLVEFVAAVPAAELSPSLIDQVVAIVELQAGQATEPHDHSAYAWRVVTGVEPVLAALAGHSPRVSDLVDRALGACPADSPLGSGDMVHADLNPGNVLVRDGTVVALVDIGNAGRGTRATDLMTLLWHSLHGSLDEARGRLWAGILGIAGWDGAAVLAATQILLQLEWPLRLGLADIAEDAVERGNRVLDELHALR